MRVDKALAKAFQIALTEIEKEARKAIEASPERVKSFCMVNGGASFHVVWLADWDGEKMPMDENLTPSEFAQHGHINPHVDNIARILGEYNGMLRIAAYPMMITRDSITGELIKLNNW